MKTSHTGTVTNESASGLATEVLEYQVKPTNVGNSSLSVSSHRDVSLSIVVPTYNESENMPDLIERIKTSLDSLSFELIVVDDSSPDRTGEVVEKLNNDYGNIIVLRRLRKLGLSSAVMDGFEKAKADVLAVMDADLQHPPELLPKMYSKIKEGDDLVIASRFIDGGKIERWGLHRRIISITARILTHVLLPETRRIKDVTSGFFMLKRDGIDGLNLGPVGYKILLEILIKGKNRSVSEVPYVFKPRKKGKSNLGVLEIRDYLLQLYKTLRG